MTKLTKADAARQLGIARSTFYKLIDQGKISPTPDGMIDQAELVCVAAYVDTFKGHPRTPSRHPHQDRIRHYTDVCIQMSPDARRQPWTNVRKRRRTSSWLSCANSFTSYVKNYRKPDKALKLLANGKLSCSRCSRTCNSATIGSSTCPAVPHRHAPAQRGSLGFHPSHQSRKHGGVVRTRRPLDQSLILPGMCSGACAHGAMRIRTRDRVCGGGPIISASRAMLS